jgi:hypothetical protein
MNRENSLALFALSPASRELDERSKGLPNFDKLSPKGGFPNQQSRIDFDMSVVNVFYILKSDRLL